MILPLTAPEGKLSITSVIKNNPNKLYVKAVQEYCDKVRMHNTGLNLGKYLARIDYYEKAELLELRKKYSPSNKDFFGRLHRPIDKIWKARGGSANYYLSASDRKKLLNILKDVKDGYSIRRWLETFWIGPMHYDPMGMIFMEVSNDSVYPTYKSCMDVFDYPPPSGRRFEYIVFNIDQKIIKEKADPAKANDQYFRVVDDANDYLIKWDGDKATIIEDESYPNHFETVPAITIGNCWDPVYHCYVSPDNNIIDVADQHLRDRSVLTMFKLHHGFPLKWLYGSDCPTCNGTKKISGKDCPSCKGSGKKSKYDVSETIVVPFPKTGDPMPKDYAGFYTPPVESWDKMDETIAGYYRDAHYTIWGTHQMEDSESAQPATATGRFIDVQPVNDRLNNYSDAAEFVESWITNMIGEFNFSSYEGCEINYGRRYLIESPDDIWKKYEEARKNGANDTSLNFLYLQYLQAEFASDSIELSKQIKLMKLDYWFHVPLSQASTVLTNPEDLCRKVNFPMWVMTLDPNDLITKDLKTLMALRDAYLDKKVKENNARIEKENAKENLKIQNTKP